MGIAEISSKSNEDLDYDRECSVPPLPGDIAKIRPNSDGDTWSFQRPQIQIESARLSPCEVDIDVWFFPIVLGVGLNPTPAYGRWVKSHVVLSHCFRCATIEFKGRHMEFPNGISTLDSDKV